MNYYVVSIIEIKYSSKELLIYITNEGNFCSRNISNSLKQRKCILKLS